MPRGRCHFALLLELQARLVHEVPELGALTARYLPEFLAGSMAPDAMRSLGNLGKLRVAFLHGRPPRDLGQIRIRHV